MSIPLLKSTNASTYMLYKCTNYLMHNYVHAQKLLHTHTHARTRTRTHTHVHTHMHTHKHTHTHTHAHTTHTYTYTHTLHTYTHTHTHTHNTTHNYVATSMCAGIHTCTRMYIYNNVF